MKRIFFLLAISALTLTAQAQNKKQEIPQDTTIAVTMNINQFRALLSVIDANIDSKKMSKELLDFLQQNARIVNQTPPTPKKEEKKEDKPKN